VPRKSRDAALPSVEPSICNRPKRDRKGKNAFISKWTIATIASLILLYLNNASFFGQTPFKNETSRHDEAKALADLPEDSIYRLSVPDIHGVQRSLLQYAGYVTLVVNVACE